MSTVTGAAGIGLATLAADGSVLDTWFPAPELTESGTSATSRLAVSDVPVELAALIGRDDDRRTETIAVRTVIGSLDDVAADPYDAYLRLHLLSHRLVAPHGLNASGLFGVLTNVVWTNHGPCAIDGFEAVRARLRRNDDEPAEMLSIADVEIDVPAHKVTRNGEQISLTPLEFDLLVALARKPRQVFTRDVLLEQVWGYRHPADTRLVNVHVQRLRAKVEKDPENPTVVLTVRGVGYKAGPP